jgi:site-specific DNA recombinase
VRARKVDVIVVYKIDRLTRSLTDFARLAKLLDAHGVSFVSVTQQFNTTSSMGRLTLNVLLSFAQFEREIAGERIRDKIAASKKKGMWMGGSVPLGYDLEDKKLIVNTKEAETVRTLFRLYLKFGSVRATAIEAARLGLTTKVRAGKQGEKKGGGPFRRGHLYTILRNPIYIGRIPHKGDSYPGVHDAITDSKTWEATQRRFAENSNGEHRRGGESSSSLLTGLLFDTDGTRFTPSHTVKNGRRFRYYVERALITGEGPSRAKVRRIPAHEIETLVCDSVIDILVAPDRLLKAVGDVAGADEAEQAIRQGRHLHLELITATPDAQASLLRPMLRRVVLGEGKVGIMVARGSLRTALGLSNRGWDDHFHELTIPARITTSGVGIKLVVGNGVARSRQANPELIKLIARAHDWWQRLLSDEADSIRKLATAEGVSRAYMGRVLRLAFLAPDIVKAILDGEQPPELSIKRQLLHQHLPFSWSDQRRLLGFAGLEVGPPNSRKETNSRNRLFGAA